VRRDRGKPPREVLKEEVLRVLGVERTRHGGFACGRHRKEFELAVRRALERSGA
jgi:hypothetical protein